jgi:hypothetical protein
MIKSQMAGPTLNFHPETNLENLTGFGVATGSGLLIALWRQEC